MILGMDKLLGLIGMLSGTSMLHEDYCQSHATLEPTLLQVRVSNSIQTRTWKKINHESWANLPFKRKLYLSVRNCNRQNDTHINCNWYVHVNDEKQHHRKTKLQNTRQTSSWLQLSWCCSYMCRLMTKKKWLCAQRRLRSAWASAQSDQSLRFPLNG